MEHIGWERTLLGTVIHSPEEMDKADDLRPGDFTGCHTTLWGVSTALHRTGTLEPRTLIETLRERGLLEQISSFEDADVTGEDYIRELVRARGANMDHYVDQILQSATRRQLETTAAIMVSYARDTHMTADEALDRAESRVIEIRRNRSADAGTTLRNLMGIFMPRIDQMMAGSFVPAYTPSLTNLRSLVAYVEEDEYITIAARPGHGKSSLLRREAFSLVREQTPVLIFNLENSEIEYARAFLAMSLGINNQVLKNPRGMQPALYGQIAEMAERLAELPLHIVSMGAPSVAEMARVARAKIASSGIRLIMVDYIQLIDNGQDNDTADISTSSKAFRGWGLNFKVPVIAASQLNRDIEKRGKDARPMLADLRSSGSIEQDSTQVWFPRPVWGEPEPQQLAIFAENKDSSGNLLPKPPAIPVRLYIEKNRNGPTGVTDPILWDRSTGRYRDLAVDRVDLSG